jgi:hypothetical protein
VASTPSFGPSSIPRASHLPKDAFGNLTLPPSATPDSGGVPSQVSPLVEYATPLEGPIFEADEESEDRDETHVPETTRKESHWVYSQCSI